MSQAANPSFFWTGVAMRYLLFAVARLLGWPRLSVPKPKIDSEVNVFLSFRQQHMPDFTWLRCSFRGLRAIDEDCFDLCTVLARDPSRFVSTNTRTFASLFQIWCGQLTPRSQ